MADSFVNFEKSVENMSNLSGAQKGAAGTKKGSKK